MTFSSYIDQANSRRDLWHEKTLSCLWYKIHLTVNFYVLFLGSIDDFTDLGGKRSPDYAIDVLPVKNNFLCAQQCRDRQPDCAGFTTTDENATTLRCSLYRAPINWEDDHYTNAWEKIDLLVGFDDQGVCVVWDGGEFCLCHKSNFKNLSDWT